MSVKKREGGWGRSGIRVGGERERKRKGR